MGYDISSGVSFESVYFDFFSTYVGSSVIGTRTSKGFDVITHKLTILVFTKNKICSYSISVNIFLLQQWNESNIFNWFFKWIGEMIDFVRYCVICSRALSEWSNDKV